MERLIKTNTTQHKEKSHSSLKAINEENGAKPARRPVIQSGESVVRNAHFQQQRDGHRPVSE